MLVHELVWQWDEIEDTVVLLGQMKGTPLLAFLASGPGILYKNGLHLDLSTQAVLPGRANHRREQEWLFSQGTQDALNLVQIGRAGRPQVPVAHLVQGVGAFL